MLSAFVITAIVIVGFVVGIAVCIGIAAAYPEEEYEHVETSRRADALNELEDNDNDF